MSYTYLASPYTHPDASIMTHRYNMALAAFTQLLNNRIWTYSPIVHCHPAALQFSLPRNIDFWQDYNKAMIVPASAFTILTLDGWQESRGVTWEINVAETHHIPISFLTPDTFLLTKKPWSPTP